jgi:hypothetical protein
VADFDSGVATIESGAAAVQEDDEPEPSTGRGTIFKPALVSRLRMIGPFLRRLEGSIVCRHSIVSRS